MALRSRTRDRNPDIGEETSSSNADDVVKTQRDVASSTLASRLVAFPPVRWSLNLLTNPRYFWTLASLLFVAEVALNALIIKRISYTEIDWKAYMQEVAGYLRGETDYLKLRGDTGPLVYPAGFVYIYSAFYYLTEYGRNIQKAQWIFMGLYLATFWVVASIYAHVSRERRRGDDSLDKKRQQELEKDQQDEERRRRRKDEWALPPYVLLLVSASRRLHSIYVLRLFNDPVAMFFMYAATLAMVRKHWTLSSILFSLALSIKMNILLFFPAFGFLLWEALGASKTMVQLGIIALIQVLLSLPFTLHHASSYIARAFEFSRVFMYQWTVNWKMLPETVFISRPFALVLLASHAAVLLLFLHARWSRGLAGGVVTAFLRGWTASERTLAAHAQAQRAERVVTLLWTSNFMGIVFSRSLHYQFYSWYAMTLPYLLWRASFLPSSFSNSCRRKTTWALLESVVRLGLWALIEWSWNVFPATAASSWVLLSCHLALLAGLWRGTKTSGTVEEL